MDFKDTIQQIVEKIAKQKDSIATEEATKTSFVMPVMQHWGMMYSIPLRLYRKWIVT